jgi:hypothetical protein
MLNIFSLLIAVATTTADIVTHDFTEHFVWEYFTCGIGVDSV